MGSDAYTSLGSGNEPSMASFVFDVYPFSISKDECDLGILCSVPLPPFLLFDLDSRLLLSRTTASSLDSNKI